MAGIGSQPFGSSPYGVGTPDVAADLGGTVLAESGTGSQKGSRYIDPRTGDYALNTSTGRIAGMDDVKQLVLLRMKTTKGSAAYQRLGHELKKIDRITNNVQTRIAATIEEAVEDLVTGGLIETVALDIQVIRPGVIFARFAWRNLLTGLEDEASFPLTE